MPTRNVFNTPVSGGNATVFNTAGNTTSKTGSRSRGKVEDVHRSTGEDSMKRNYVQYLIARYNRFREADARFRRVKTRFSDAFIFRRIEAQFKAPTYSIPVDRFAELLEYLQGGIDQTILGKRNHALGHRNYETFDEHQSGRCEAVG